MLEKKEKKRIKKEMKKDKKKRALLKKRVSQNKVSLFELSFGFRVANHYTTDTHRSFVRLRIYISPMYFLIWLQTVSPLKSQTCLD